MKKPIRGFIPTLSVLALGLSACGGTVLEPEPAPGVTSRATPLVTVVQLRPTSDVANNNVVGVGSTTQLYTNVDDGTSFTAANDADAVRGVDGMEWTSHVVGFSSTASGTVTEVAVNVRGLLGTGAGTLQVVLFDGDQVVRYGGERALTTAQNITETFSGISVSRASNLRVKVVLHNTRGSGSLRYYQGRGPAPRALPQHRGQRHHRGPLARHRPGRFRCAHRCAGRCHQELRGQGLLRLPP